MRAPRRTFANPFVITLAALPLGACVADSTQHSTAPNPPPPTTPVASPEPTPTNPPPPRDPVVIANPPRPVEPPPEATPEPAPRRPPIMNPPRPEPAADFKTAPPPQTDRHWNVYNNKGTCHAGDTDACRMPNRKPNDPIPPCNPPMPQPIKCPVGLAVGDSINILQKAGQPQCFVDIGKCPANAKCMAKQVDCP